VDTRITADTLTTAVPIMGDIHMVRMGTGIPLTVVARVQERLARAGYYRGPIDGLMGPRTHYAIRVYERSHGLPADGIIDRRLLATMGIA